MTEPAPIQEKVIDDSGYPSLPWVLFFSGMYDGDSGTNWTPTFTSLTEAGGSATITGKYYRISQYLTLFRVTITPATSTTSTAGTTYIDNFPVNFTSDGICFAVSGGTGSNSGHIVASNNRIYTPAWNSVTVPLTILGIGEAT